MNLKDLVPPLELCKKIPAGEFEDSALVYSVSQDKILQAEIFIDLRELAEYRVNQIKDDLPVLYPAPTLQEIMDKFVILTVAGAIEDENKQFATSIGGTQEYYKTHSIFEQHICCPVPTNATAALKLWLELKGIEND